MSMRQFLGRIVNAHLNTFGYEVRKKLGDFPVSPSPQSSGPGDELMHKEVVFIGTAKYGLHGCGKMTPRVFLPPFMQALQQNGFRGLVHDSISSLRVDSLQKPAFVLVYNEEAELFSAPATHSELLLIEATLREKFPGAPIFNSVGTAAIIGDKLATNRAFLDAGIPVPKPMDASTSRVFSNVNVGSHLPVSLLEPGEPLDPERYNTTFVNTVHKHRGSSYYVCLRAMAVGPELVSVYVRARPTEAGSPSVHSTDTPLDASLINSLYMQLVLPRLDQIWGVCRSIAEVLGAGFYAHDILPCADTGDLYVCESGFKFNDMTLLQHLKPIAHQFVVADFLGDAEQIRSAYAFMKVLQAMDPMGPCQ